MANTTYMHQKFSVDTLVSHYVQEIRSLQPLARTPAEETQLQIYAQAASAFKQVSIKDLVQFALSYGRTATGKAASLKSALPTVLGNRVMHPTPIDLVYAKLLLEYLVAFKQYKSNIKEWMLRFVISSRFSPLHHFIDSELDRAILNTQQKIATYGQH